MQKIKVITEHKHSYRAATAVIARNATKGIKKSIDQSEWQVFKRQTLETSVIVVLPQTSGGESLSQQIDGKIHDKD